MRGQRGIRVLVALVATFGLLVVTPAYAAAHVVVVADPLPPPIVPPGVTPPPPSGTNEVPPGPTYEITPGTPGTELGEPVTGRSSGPGDGDPGESDTSGGTQKPSATTTTKPTAAAADDPADPDGDLATVQAGTGTDGTDLRWVLGSGGLLLFVLLELSRTVFGRREP